MKKKTLQGPAKKKLLPFLCSRPAIYVTPTALPKSIRQQRKKTVTYFITGQYYYGDPLSKRAVDVVFQAMYTLTDLRVLLRETAPLHELDAEQKAQAQRLLENLERQVGSLKQEILK